MRTKNVSIMVIIIIIIMIINLSFLYQCLSWRIEFFMQEAKFLWNSVQWQVILVLRSSRKKVITFISERAIH